MGEKKGSLLPTQCPASVSPQCCIFLPSHGTYTQPSSKDTTPKSGAASGSAPKAITSGCCWLMMRFLVVLWFRSWNNQCLWLAAVLSPNHIHSPGIEIGKVQWTLLLRRKKKGQKTTVIQSDAEFLESPCELFFPEADSVLQAEPGSTLWGWLLWPMSSTTADSFSRGCSLPISLCVTSEGVAVECAHRFIGVRTGLYSQSSCLIYVYTDSSI